MDRKLPASQYKKDIECFTKGNLVALYGDPVVKGFLSVITVD